MEPLTREESQRIDALAGEKLHLPPALLMENAGRGAAEAALALATKLQARRAIVVCGPGNNGGDGLVAARHLLDKIPVEVWLCAARSALSGGAKENLERFEALGELALDLPDEAILPDFEAALKQPPAPLIVDALFGTGLTRPIAGLLAAVIERINASGHPVLAIDLPSGLDADTGAVLGTAIKAKSTVTFVAPKKGCTAGEGPARCGEVIVADIGFPGTRRP